MKIQFFDTTLRDGEQAPGNTMEPNQKLQIAIALEKIGVNIIEAGFPVACKEDFQACQLIAKEIKTSTICTLARCVKSDIDVAYQSIQKAHKPSVQLFIPGSDTQLTNRLKKTRAQALELVSNALIYAKNFFPTIYFGIEDATQSEFQFLSTLIELLNSHNVDTITIPDTVGFSYPENYEKLFTKLKSKFPNTNFSAHCHDDLGFATANTLSAIKAGASQIQTTVNGIGERAGNASFEEIIVNLLVKADHYNVDITHIDSTQIYELSQLVYKILNRPSPYEKPVVGTNSFRHESGIWVDGLIKESHAKNVINPNLFGRKRELIYGRHSGKIEKFNKSS